MRVAVDFTWDEKGVVGLSAAGRLEFPSVPRAPAVYRFRVSEESGVEVYIGESQDVRRRMQQNYATTHTGPTNVRVRELLVQYLEEGRTVHLAIVNQAVLEVEGKQLIADLTEKHIRLLVENAALVLAYRAGERIHNL